MLQFESQHAGVKGPDLWDSGVIKGSGVSVKYRGKHLSSRMRCHFQITVTDANNNLYSSRIDYFEMGLLDKRDWHGAVWIARTDDTSVVEAPYLRKSFKLSSPHGSSATVTSARLYVSGLGFARILLNGHHVTENVMDPTFTRYDKRVLYNTYDVTELIQAGFRDTNGSGEAPPKSLFTLGAVLGNGWYNHITETVWDFYKAPWRAAPKMKVQLHIKFSDGNSSIVVSDATWEARSGPIGRNCIYGGEVYDVNKEDELGAWTSPQEADSSTEWAKVTVVADPLGKLVADSAQPVRYLRRLHAKNITLTAEGWHLIDFGENIAGGIELVLPPAVVREPSKDARLNSDGSANVLLLRFGEKLAGDHLWMKELRNGIEQSSNKSQPFAEVRIVLPNRDDKNKRRVYRSTFTYFGFRFMKMEGWPDDVPFTADLVTAKVGHTATPKVGSFYSSNDLINSIHAASRRSFLSNLWGIPTDCPHREKNGWTADAHGAAEAGLYNFDIAAFYERWLDSFEDEQRPNGKIPAIIPSSGWGYQWGNGPYWDSAWVILAFYQYKWYGDISTLEKHYGSLKDYMNYLSQHEGVGEVKDTIQLGLPDWATWKTDTPARLTDTAIYYYDAKIMAAAARIMGRKDDKMSFEALANRLKGGFQSVFMKNSTSVGENSQTSLSCALYYGLVPDDIIHHVMQLLIRKIHENNYHVDVGNIGTKCLLNVLVEFGRADLAYRVVNQRDLPSWGYFLTQPYSGGTLWEMWDDDKTSLNHVLYIEVDAFFYRALAGIQPTLEMNNVDINDDVAGFKHFVIHPRAVGDLTFVEGHYDSPLGEVRSIWNVKSLGEDAAGSEKEPFISAGNEETIHRDPRKARYNVDVSELEACNSFNTTLKTEKTAGTGTLIFQIHVGIPPGSIASLFVPVLPHELVNARSNTTFTHGEELGEVSGVTRDGRACSLIKLEAGSYHLHGPLQCVMTGQDTW